MNNIYNLLCDLAAHCKSQIKKFGQDQTAKELVDQWITELNNRGIIVPSYPTQTTTTVTHETICTNKCEHDWQMFDNNSTKPDYCVKCGETK